MQVCGAFRFVVDVAQAGRFQVSLKPAVMVSEKYILGATMFPRDTVWNPQKSLSGLHSKVSIFFSIIPIQPHINTIIPIVSIFFSIIPI